jgi:hypothetical protein
MDFPNVEERGINWDGVPISNSKAIVNPDTGETFSIVSNSYKLVPYQELTEVVDDILKGEDYTKSVDFIGGGKRYQAVYRFKSEEYQLQGGPVNPSIVVRGSYDRSWLTSIDFGGYRVVCSNGLVVGTTYVSYRKKHSSGLDYDEMRRVIQVGMDDYKKQVDVWRTWQDVVTTPAMFEYVMKRLDLRTRYQEQLNQEVEVSSNLTLEDFKVKTLPYWLFFNLVTQFVTHKVVSNQLRIRLEDRMRKAFYR